MKKLLTTVALSLSTLVAASAAMADPYDYHHDDRHHDRVVMTEHTVWKEGARFPDHYHDQRYYVDDYHHYNYINLIVSSVGTRLMDVMYWSMNARIT